MKERVHGIFERRYRLLSYEFCLRSDFDDVGEFLDSLLAGFGVPRGGRAEAPEYALSGYTDRPGWVALYLDGRCLNAAPSWPQVLDSFFWRLNRETFVRVDDRLIVHAAGVSQDGAGIILPGPPNSGKTTLSAAMMWAGFRFLSDEAALIDPETRWMHPFPRVLAVDGRSNEALQQFGVEVSPPHHPYTGSTSYIRPDRWGRIGDTCCIRYAIAPRYEAGHDTTIEPATRADMLVTLVENCFNFEAFGRASLSLLADVVRDAQCYRLVVGDLGDAVRTIRAIVE